MDECFPDRISNAYIHLAHNCHVDANCTNTEGSFHCTCHTGYSGDGVVCLGITFPWYSIVSSHLSEGQNKLTLTLHSRPKKAKALLDTKRFLQNEKPFIKYRTFSLA